MKTAILFSGQGSQHPGMMQELFLQYPCAMDVFDLAQRITGRDIYNFIMHASQMQLDETENTQICLLTCQLAALRVLRQLNIPFEAVMGFSLGEWAALVAAEAASEAEVLEAIVKRAAAMQRAVPLGQGAMAAVLGKDVDFVEKLCGEIGEVAPANYSCPGNISVAGTSQAIDRLFQRADADGIMAVKIAVSIPSHCWLMEPAVKELTPVVEKLRLQTPKTPLFMNVTGMEAAASEEIKENLICQLSRPVLFMQAIERMLETGYDTFIEIGPDNTLCKAVKRTAKQKRYKIRAVPVYDLETIGTAQKLFEA